DGRRADGGRGSEVGFSGSKPQRDIPFHVYEFPSIAVLANHTPIHPTVYRLSVGVPLRTAHARIRVRRATREGTCEGRVRLALRARGRRNGRLRLRRPGL